MARPQPRLAAAAVLLLVLLACVAEAFAFVPPQRARPSAGRCHTGSGSGTPTVQPVNGASHASSTLAASVIGQEAPTKGATKGTLPSQFWTWKRAPGEEYRIRYQHQGDSGPVVICVHGFGGNCDHWRKNLPVLGQKYRTYSIDLLGYGFSDKPDPRSRETNELYCFETWARQIEAFVQEVVKPEDGVYVVCNSVGGLVGLQLCLDRPDLVNGIMLLNISLRMLHIKKQPALLRPFVKALQTALRETPLGGLFFAQIATPKGVRNVLEQAYHNKSTVTDELIEVILKPGLEPGALPVFLDFISYSGGPLPEELLPQLTDTPVYIGWGEEDPWEPVELGKAYGDFPVVREFVRLPGLGHCPQDEGPEVVNPFVGRMVDTLEAERKQKQKQKQ